MNFDDRLRWRARGESIPVPAQFDARISGILTALPARRARRHTALRVILAAAAICALLGATTWAYVSGAFPFLKDKEEYRFLGQAELYEKYAETVNQEQTAANGDVLTVESVALDGNSCTVFYTVRTKAPMVPRSFSGGDAASDEPDLWKGMNVSPHFSVTARGVDITGSSSMLGQQFMMNDRTLCGMARIALNRPLERGESYYLRVSPSFAELVSPSGNHVGGVMPDKWLFTLSANPLETRFILSEQTAQVLDGHGNSHDVKYVSFSHSELSTILKLGELVPEAYRGDPSSEWPELEFVIRDGNTGAYIPYSYVSGSNGGMRYITYELYGVSDDMGLLELIPIRRAEKSGWRTVALSDLPVRSGNDSGGYAMSSVELRKDKIVVTQHPIGATTAASSGVSFLDSGGNRLFDGEDVPDGRVYADVFIDGTDGSVITTYSLSNIPGSYLNRIAQVRFYDDEFTLMEGETITVSLR